MYACDTNDEPGCWLVGGSSSSSDEYQFIARSPRQSRDAIQKAVTSRGETGRCGVATTGERRSGNKLVPLTQSSEDQGLNTVD